MYEIIYTGQFKKSLKRCVRRGLDITEFTTVLDILQEKGVPILICFSSKRDDGKSSRGLWC